MDRSLAMLILLGFLVILSLIILALFAMAPIFSSCLVSLVYTLYIFLSNESHGVHHAQEFENRFWSIFTILFSTALFFAKDSPIAFGNAYPSLGFLGVLTAGYTMHTWDRYNHRKDLNRVLGMKRSTQGGQSLLSLRDSGIPIEDQLSKINSCLSDIDQLLIPSTINNLIKHNFILRKEREIISIFEEAQKNALNYLVSHSRLSLLFYKIKDHRHFNGKHRTELIELLAVDRLPLLTVVSKVIVLHALQMMKLPANTKAEYWVKNIIVSTSQDDLSELKTRTDSKGDHLCMNKLIYEDIRKENVRQDILNHIQRQAKTQLAHRKYAIHSRSRIKQSYRKVLSDVDDTLTCSGGSYPSGIDKRYGKKVVYPGVLAFYRELDLGTEGREEWLPSTIGNLVFLSARPHVYKDITEKRNFAKFERLRAQAGEDGRGGMHTMPSLLAGDISSGTEFIMKNEFEPLAQKKFENFQQYMSIYPEFFQIFICDNGQGDVRASELMYNAFPQHLEAIYVHVVQNKANTYKYDPDSWKDRKVKPFFFSTYPEAALDAVTRVPPLIRLSGLQRICQDAISDFYMIQTKNWQSQKQKYDRRDELNQALWRCNEYLISCGTEIIPLIETEELWRRNQKVNTPYGKGKIISFDPVLDMYEIEIDWRPLHAQIKEYQKSTVDEKTENINVNNKEGHVAVLETVIETGEEVDEEFIDKILQNKDSLKDESKTSVTLVNLPHLTQSMDNMSEDMLNLKSRSDEGVSFKNKEFKGKVKISVGKVIAKIQGRHIATFTPPKPPAFTKEGEARSAFSFWGSKNDLTYVKTQVQNIYTIGDKCSTPFGLGIILEQRNTDGFFEVDLLGWSARAYLREKDVDISGEGVFGSLFRIFTSSDSSSQKKFSTTIEIDSPIARESIIQTPFGEGKVLQSRLYKQDQKLILTPIQLSDGLTQNSVDGDKSCSSKGPSVLSSKHSFETIGISLTSWRLANGDSPIVYSTLETVADWKKYFNAEERSRMSGGWVSVFGSLVSHSMRLIIGQQGKKEIPSEIVLRRFERYYKDGASVSTSYGDGCVKTFREIDGFYEVYLSKWKMMGNIHPIAYLPKESLNYCLANGCHEGYPVLTSYNVSGILASVESSTGVHIVTVPSAGLICYLQPKDVIHPLKAAVGEDILTQFGEGQLKKYRSEDDIYEIELSSGAKFYGKAEAFDRVKDGLEDNGGRFGMTRLLQFFFFSSENNYKGEGQRSRSNSVTSLSMRSHSSRSVI